MTAQKNITLPFTNGIEWFTPETIGNHKEGGYIVECYEDSKVKRYGVCPDTSWAFVELIDGRFMATALNDGYIGDEKSCINFLKESF